MFNVYEEVKGRLIEELKGKIPEYGERMGKYISEMAVKTFVEDYEEIGWNGYYEFILEVVRQLLKELDEIDKVAEFVEEVENEDKVNEKNCDDDCKNGDCCGDCCGGCKGDCCGGCQCIYSRIYRMKGGFE